MDKQRRRHLYNRCRLGEALPVDDLDERRVRGIDWVARLASRIELSDRPSCQLFTGLPGSGKSTELQRLAQRLGRREDANLHVVLIDAEEEFDLSVSSMFPTSRRPNSRRGPRCASVSARRSGRTSTASSPRSATS